MNNRLSDNFWDTMFNALENTNQAEWQAFVDAFDRETGDKSMEETNMQTIENEKLKLEIELLEKQVDHLKEKLCGLILSTKTARIEPIGVVFHKPEPTVTVAQTPAGNVKVGDMVFYDRSNKQVRFGVVHHLSKDGWMKLTKCGNIRFGEDNKQTIYDNVDNIVELYRICKII